MAWMSEIAIMIEDAHAFGVTLDLSSFGRKGDSLTIDGVDADEWFAAHELRCQYCERAQSDSGSLDAHLQFCEPMR